MGICPYYALWAYTHALYLISESTGHPNPIETAHVMVTGTKTDDTHKGTLFSLEEGEQVKEDMDSVFGNVNIMWMQCIRGLPFHQRFHQIVLSTAVDHTIKALDSFKRDEGNAYFGIEEPDAEIMEQAYAIAVVIDRTDDIVKKCTERIPSSRTRSPHDDEDTDLQ
jgi:hypothetical protein